MVTCSRAAHFYNRGTEAGLSALQPRRGSELGGASRPSRPCCLPEESVEALATRSADEPNELENRLGHSGGRTICAGRSWVSHSADGLSSDQYVVPAPSSSRAAHAPVTNCLAPTPDITCEYVEPAPVIGYIAPASAAPGSRDLSEASTPMVVGSPLHLEGITAPYIYQEQIVAWEATQKIVTPVHLR